jgi:hypothetical protein
MDTSITLLIPQKTDIEHEQIFSAWIENGGQVKRLDKFWIKDEELAKQRIAIYGNQAFAFVVAQIYNVELLSPDDTLVARLESKWTKRTIQLRQIGQLSAKDFPTFIKPVVPKIFIAGIFKNIENFKKVSEGLPDTEEILTSTIIPDIQAEARCYVKDGVVMDVAFYEGSADLHEGEKFVSDFVAENKEQVPRVFVIDIAFDEQTGWLVLEFNACWGAGLNNCKAENVIDCIIGATINAL